MSKILDVDLQRYIDANTTAPDQVMQDLAAETRDALDNRAGMQIGVDQARFMTMLVQTANAKTAVEIGTFTGMSSLAIARGLAPGGTLTCFDVSDEYTAIARRYWERDGVSDRITLVLGDAREETAKLPSEPHIDFAFIDADKSGYATYWDNLVPRMKPGGLIAIDNVLQRGRVVNDDSDNETVVAIRAFNSKTIADSRVDQVMLGMRDGVTLARKR